MIKTEFNTDCKSFFKEGKVWDSYSKKTRKIKIFGITFFEREENYTADISDNNKSTGFKNHNE
jgi:hypothetical protein